MKRLNQIFAATLLAAFVVGVVPTTALSLCLSPPGDLTGSGFADVADAQCSIITTLRMLRGEPLPICLAGPVATADSNCDGHINVADSLLVIQYAMRVPVSPLLDADGDKCPDKCTPQTPTPYTDPELVALYLFDEGQGALTADATHGEGVYPMTLTNAEWVPSIFGHGVAFDVDGKGVAAPRIETTTPNAFTVGVWTKPADYNKLQAVVANGNPYSMQQHWALYIADGRMLALLNTVDMQEMVITPTRPVVPNEWQHLALVVDIEQGELRFYHNGEMVYVYPWTEEMSVEPALSLMVGMGATTPVGYCGAVDELAIWARVLTDAEIAEVAAMP